MALTITLVILTAAMVLLIAFIARQERKTRRIEKTLDYSRVRKWDDEEDEK